MERNETPAERGTTPVLKEPGRILEALLRKARWRKAAGDALRGAQTFAVALPLATVVLILALRAFDSPWKGLLFPIAAGAILFLFGSLALRAILAFHGSARPLRVAWELDRRLDMKDAYATSLEIVKSGESGFFSTALVECTARSIDAENVSRAFPIPWFSTRWAASAVLMAFAVLSPFLVRLVEGRLPWNRELPLGVTVPDLVGNSFPVALEEIEKCGLSTGKIEWITEEGVPEMVTAQDPPAGASVKRGTAVNLRAFGVAVPDVRGKFLEAAAKILENRRLKTGEVTWHRGEEPKSCVKGQTPPGGEIVEPGSAVDLRAVGVGVPNVLARPIREAEKTLQAAGLTIGEVTLRPWLGPPGMVTGQKPVPEDTVKPGTIVELTVSAPVEVRGPRPFPKPADPESADPGGPPPPSEQSNGGEGEGRSGRKPPLLGDPERTPSEYEDVKVKPLFGPRGKAHLVELEVPVLKVKGVGTGPGQGNSPKSELNELLIQYERRAEHALTTGRIGKEDRETVIGYFERVKGILNGHGK